MSYLMIEIAIDTTFYYNLAIDSGKKWTLYLKQALKHLNI